MWNTFIFGLLVGTVCSVSSQSAGYPKVTPSNPLEFPIKKPADSVIAADEQKFVQTVKPDNHDHHHYHGEDGKYNPHDDGTGWDIRKSIPGEPGKDYPTYHKVPSTDFTCASRPPGYYADVETRCQVFRVCTTASERAFTSFLCPNGSLFNQRSLICDWWQNVDCSDTDYSSNNFIEMPVGQKLMEAVAKMINYPFKDSTGDSSKPVQTFLNDNQIQETANHDYLPPANTIETTTRRYYTPTVPTTYYSSARTTPEYLPPEPSTTREYTQSFYSTQKPYTRDEDNSNYYSTERTTAEYLPPEPSTTRRPITEYNRFEENSTPQTGTYPKPSYTTVNDYLPPRVTTQAPSPSPIYVPAVAINPELLPPTPTTNEEYLPGYQEEENNSYSEASYNRNKDDEEDESDKDTGYSSESDDSVLPEGHPGYEYKVPKVNFPIKQHDYETTPVPQQKQPNSYEIGSVANRFDFTTQRTTTPYTTTPRVTTPPATYRTYPTTTYRTTYPTTYRTYPTTTYRTTYPTTTYPTTTYRTTTPTTTYRTTTPTTTYRTTTPTTTYRTTTPTTTYRTTTPTTYSTTTYRTTTEAYTQETPTKITLYSEDITIHPEHLGDTLPLNNRFEEVSSTPATIDVTTGKSTPTSLSFNFSESLDQKTIQEYIQLYRDAGVQDNIIRDYLLQAGVKSEDIVFKKEEKPQNRFTDIKEAITTSQPKTTTPKISVVGTGIISLEGSTFITDPTTTTTTTIRTTTTTEEEEPEYDDVYEGDVKTTPSLPVSQGPIAGPIIPQNLPVNKPVGIVVPDQTPPTIQQFPQQQLTPTQKFTPQNQPTIQQNIPVQQFTPQNLPANQNFPSTTVEFQPAQLIDHYNSHDNTGTQGAPLRNQIHVSNINVNTKPQGFGFGNQDLFNIQNQAYQNRQPNLNQIRPNQIPGLESVGTIINDGFYNLGFGEGVQNIEVIGSRPLHEFTFTGGQQFAPNFQQNIPQNLFRNPNFGNGNAGQVNQIRPTVGTAGQPNQNNKFGTGTSGLQTNQNGQNTGNQNANSGFRATDIRFGGNENLGPILNIDLVDQFGGLKFENFDQILPGNIQFGSNAPQNLGQTNGNSGLNAAQGVANGNSGNLQQNLANGNSGANIQQGFGAGVSTGNSGANRFQSPSPNAGQNAGLSNGSQRQNIPQSFGLVNGPSGPVLTGNLNQRGQLPTQPTLFGGFQPLVGNPQRGQQSSISGQTQIGSRPNGNLSGNNGANTANAQRKPNNGQEILGTINGNQNLGLGQIVQGQNFNQFGGLTNLNTGSASVEIIPSLNFDFNTEEGRKNYLSTLLKEYGDLDFINNDQFNFGNLNSQEISFHGPNSYDTPQSSVLALPSDAGFGNAFKRSTKASKDDNKKKDLEKKSEKTTS